MFHRDGIGNSIKVKTMIKIMFMKKAVISVMVVCAVMSMTSCSSCKKTAESGQATSEIVDEKKAEAVSLADLKGEWIIKSVGEKEMPEDMERTPFLSFDIDEMRVHGYTACNIANGSISQEEGKAASLRFGEMLSTMMAGPHMDTEREILINLDKVASFTLNDDKSMLSLLDADGNEVIRLQKNTGKRLSD